jgi:hypothetical protein
LLNNLETILNYSGKRNGWIIRTGDLNKLPKKNASNKKGLEVLLSMVGLQAVICVLTSIIKAAKAAINQIIWNTRVVGFKIDVLETALSDNFRQILQL